MSSARWQDDALCAEIPGADRVFFPGKGENDLTRMAKALCGLCTVQGDCLAYAHRTRQWYGVWGGLSAEEREAQRRGACAGCGHSVGSHHSTGCGRCGCASQTGLAA